MSNSIKEFNKQQNIKRHGSKTKVIFITLLFLVIGEGLTRLAEYTVLNVMPEESRKTIEESGYFKAKKEAYSRMIFYTKKIFNGEGEDSN